MVVANLKNKWPPVSVIVVNYNGLAFLDSCLESLMAVDYPNFEILLVDNASSDGSIEHVRKFAGSKRLTILINDHNLGYAGACNVGIEKAIGDYIALLNNDTMVDRNWLKETVELLEKEKTIGIVGCKYLDYHMSDVIDSVGGKMFVNALGVMVGRGQKDAGQYQTVRDDFDYVAGVGVVVRAEVLRTLNLLDEEYFMFYEDTDLCFKIRKIEYRVVYFPKAKIWHRRSATFRLLAGHGDYKFYLLNRSRIRFMLLHYSVLKVLRALVFDFLWFLLLDKNRRMLLLATYGWNSRSLRATIRKRIKNNAWLRIYQRPR